MGQDAVDPAAHERNARVAFHELGHRRGERVAIDGEGAARGHAAGERGTVEDRAQGVELVLEHARGA